MRQKNLFIKNLYQINTSVKYFFCKFVVIDRFTANICFYQLFFSQYTRVNKGIK